MGWGILQTVGPRSAFIATDAVLPLQDALHEPMHAFLAYSNQFTTFFPPRKDVTHGSHAGTLVP